MVPETFPLHVMLFLISMAFSMLGAFNRFNAAPLLCAFLIIGYPALARSSLPDRMPIVITLIAEVFASGFALLHYLHLRCVDGELVKRLGAPAIVAAIFGTGLAHLLPNEIRLTVWALLLLGVVAAWSKASSEAEPAGGSRPRSGLPGDGHLRRLVTTDGVTYLYVCTRQEIGVLLTSVGAFVTGLTSFGLGEVETINLAVRCRIPTRVAVGTGLAITLVAAVTAVGAHLVLFALQGAPRIPLWVPAMTSLGAIAGTGLGRRITRLVPTDTTTRGVYVLLAASAIGVLVFVLTHP